MANLILQEPEKTEILDLSPSSNKPIHKGRIAKHRATLYDIAMEETPGAGALQQEIESGNEDTLRDKLVAQEHRKRNDAAKLLVEDNIPFLDVEGLSYLAKTEVPNKDTVLEETFVKKANDLVQGMDDNPVLAAHRDENPMGFMNETKPFEEMAVKTQIINRMQEDLANRAKEQGWLPYIDDTIESFLTFPSWSNLTADTSSWDRGSAIFEKVDYFKSLPPGEMQMQVQAYVDELAEASMPDAQKFLAAMSVTGYSDLESNLDLGFDLAGAATSGIVGAGVKGGLRVPEIVKEVAKNKAGVQRIAEAVEAAATAAPKVDNTAEIAKVADELEDFHKYFHDEKAESKASFDQYFKPDTKDSPQVVLNKISERARALSEEIKTLDPATPEGAKRHGDIAAKIAGLREAYKRFTVLNSKESFKQYFGDASQSSFDEFFGKPPAKRTKKEYIEEAKKLVESRRGASSSTSRGLVQDGQTFAARANKPHQEIGVGYKIQKLAGGKWGLFWQEKPGATFRDLDYSEPTDVFASQEDITKYIRAREAKGWFKQVDDLDGEEAVAWRKVGDEEVVTSPSANLAKDVNAALGAKDATPESVLASAGNFAASSEIKATKTLGKKLFPEAAAAVQDEQDEIFKLVPTFTSPRVMVTGAENMDNLRAQRLIDEAERVARLRDQMISGTARVIRTPEEAFEESVRAAKVIVKDRYNHINDAIMDMRGIPPEATGLNVGMLETTIGRTSLEAWNKKEYADKFAKAAGFQPGSYKVAQQGSKYVIKAYQYLDETGKDTLDKVLSPANKPRITSWGGMQTLLKYPLGSKIHASEFQSKQRATVPAAQSALGYLLREALKPIENLSKAEYKDLNDLMHINRITYTRAGDPDSRGMFYKNTTELTDAYMKHKGRPPTEVEEQAYFAFTRASDIDWYFRSVNTLKNKALMGTENVTVSRLGPNDEIVYNTFEGRTLDNFNFNSRDYIDILVVDEKGMARTYDLSKLTDIERTTLKDMVLTKGFKVTEAYNPRDPNLMKIAGEDRPIGKIISKNNSYAPLKFSEQVNYRAGFHNEYNAPYYVKQPRVKYGRFEGDTTVLAASSEAKAIEDSRLMEKGRVLLKEGRIAELEAFLKTDLPHTLEEFRKLFDPEKGRLDLDTPFVVVKQGTRSYGSKYKLANGKRFDQQWDEKLDDTLDRLHNPSALFGDPFTAKRDPLVHEIKRGTESHPLHELNTAEQFSPMTTQIAAMGKLIKSTLYDDYQMTAASNYVETFAGELQINGTVIPIDELRKNPVYYLDKAAIPVANMKRYLQARALKNSIQNLVGTPSTWATALDLTKHGMLNQIHKRLGEKYVRMVPEKALPMVNDPLVFFRNVAFHSKLGLFNPVQYLVQGFGVLNTMMISPIHAPASIPGSLLMRTINLNPHPDILADAAKKAAHFPDWTEAKFIEAKRWMDDIAFDRIGGEYAVKADSTPPNLVKGTAEKIFLERGPLFFNMGERAVRLTGWNTAYLEYAAKNPSKVGKMTRRDAQIIHERAKVFTANMTRDSNSLWQTGLTGNITQFWSYNVRMAELMLGHQLTLAERVQLMGGHATLWGFAPGAGAALALQEGDPNYVNPFEDIRLYALENGINIDEGLPGFLYNGLASTAFAAFTGEHMNIGGRYGLSPIGLVDNIKSNIDDHGVAAGLILSSLGASGSIMGDIYKAASPVYSDIQDLITGEGKAVRITAGDIINAFREVSSFNAAMRTLYAIQGWQWVSKNNTVLENVEDTKAYLEIFKALTGIQSNKEGMVFDALDRVKDLDQADKDLSKRIKVLMRKYHSSRRAGDGADIYDVYYTEVAALIAGSKWSEKKILSVLREDPALIDSIFDDLAKKQKEPEKRRNVEDTLLKMQEQ